MPDNIFTVTNRDLASLSADRAVDIFRELLWAEATALGIGKHLITVPTAITVSDGGIDAEVRNVSLHPGQGLIKHGQTCYQIKTGTYSLRETRNIENILYRPLSRRANAQLQLQPRVRSCLDNDGTLIIVLFGQDNPELQEDEYRKAFLEKLTAFDTKYQNAKIEIWQQGHISGFLAHYPSLALKVKGLMDSPFQTHFSWAMNDDMRHSFEIGEAQERLITTVREELRRNDRAIHIHIQGEPGIGKTRFVLEATRADDLLPLVVYCATSSTIQNSRLMNEILMTDNHYSVVLVVDECNYDNRITIWNQLKNRGSRIKLITIYNEFDRGSADTRSIKMPALPNDHILHIFQQYGLAKDQAYRWLDLCSGSPRVAHILGENLKVNPEDLLSPDDRIWHRYIVGGDAQDSQEVRQRWIVLRHIALFKKFGYISPVDDEAKVIAKMVESADRNITWSRFQEIIRQLVKRKLLQGEYTLYITPKALHIWLWLDWWENYGRGFNFDELSEGFSGQLHDWFYDMFKYAAQSEAASRVVSRLLGPDGPFHDDSYLQTELGARFFLALTEADPQAALACLKKTLGQWSKDRLLAFTTGRREVIWALERIAVWENLFKDAARLLLALGEAENETWANNASGVFVDLFSLGTGAVASTEASPQQRLPVLKEALLSSSAERRRLALQACNKALESGYFTREMGAEYQGLKREPQLWTPKTYGEYFEAYRQIWQLLITLMIDLSQEEQKLVSEILLNRARGLTRFALLADMVIDTVENMAKKQEISQKKIVAMITSILHYESDKLSQHTRKRWEDLQEILVSGDFSSRMRRYVGMDLLEDVVDKQGNHTDGVQVYIEELAQQVIDNPQLLAEELPWLVTEEAQNGYRFGYALGKQDRDFALLTVILDAQKQATDRPSVFFLGGYLRVLFELDQTRWEELADQFAEDTMMRTWLPELTWRAGLSDRGALRLYVLAEKQLIDMGLFRTFIAGRMVQVLSESVFQKWLYLLLNSSYPHAVSVALDLYHIYYVDHESSHLLPDELTLVLLTHPALLQVNKNNRRDAMDDYHWTEISKAFLQHYPEKSRGLAEWMLEHFGVPGTILDRFSTTLTVLYEATKLYPTEMWQLITKYLGPPIDERAWYLKKWLRGENDPVGIQVHGGLALIPLEEIWQWVDEDIEQRAWYLASFVPKTLFQQEGQLSLAREVLCHYGQREDVREAFAANFFTEAWMGPESVHLSAVKQKLLAFAKDEDNENVKNWISEYLTDIEMRIGQAKVREERG